MATTALNIVQRLGGPTLTTLCVTVLSMRLGTVHSQASASGAFTIGFALLCGFHALLIPAAMRLPGDRNHYDGIRIPSLRSASKYF